MAQAHSRALAGTGIVFSMNDPQTKFREAMAQIAARFQEYYKQAAVLGFSEEEAKPVLHAELRRRYPDKEWLLRA